MGVRMACLTALCLLLLLLPQTAECKKKKKKHKTKYGYVPLRQRKHKTYAKAPGCVKLDLRAQGCAVEPVNASSIHPTAQQLGQTHGFLEHKAKVDGRTKAVAVKAVREGLPVADLRAARRAMTTETIALCRLWVRGVVPPKGVERIIAWVPAPEPEDRVALEEGGGCGAEVDQVATEFGGGLHLGEVLDHLRGRKRFTPTHAAQLAADVARAMSHVHFAGILHRDLRPENVALVRGSQGYVPTVTGFGMAAILPPQGGGVRTLRPVPWADSAPEVLRIVAGEEGTYGRPSDVYAFGHMLHALFTEGLDHPEFPRDAPPPPDPPGAAAGAPAGAPGLPGGDALWGAHRGVVYAGARPARPGGFHGGEAGDDAWAIVSDCWKHEPEARPTFHALAERLDKLAAPAAEGEGGGEGGGGGEVLRKPYGAT